MTKSRPPGRMTAAEHEAWLKETGQYDVIVERRRQEDDKRQARTNEWRRAEAPLVEELRAAGYQVESAWDLANSAVSYPDALPILLDHLTRPYPGPVREGIARALAVPEAKFAWDALVRMYRNEEDMRAIDGLAVAIAAAADDEVISDVIALVRDTRIGPSRILLLSALERSGDPRARAALVDLGGDSELKKEIQVILRRLKRAKH